MTEKEIIDDLIKELDEVIADCLLKQAKKIIGDEQIIINYYYDDYTKCFYVVSAKPMTNIIWKRIFNVEYGKLKYKDSLIAYFNC